MTGAAARKPSYWTVEKFRSWIESRPEEERWELIDGAAILMTPPTLAHQRIALNLQHLLNDALEQHDPSLVALERPGLNLQPEVTNYQPEPDVAVVDADSRRASAMRAGSILLPRSCLRATIARSGRTTRSGRKRSAAPIANIRAAAACSSSSRTATRFASTCAARAAGQAACPETQTISSS
jgi:hypothetical protein